MPLSLPHTRATLQTWGQLNERKDNVVLVHSILNASSHAAKNAANPSPGWWEPFIGPGAPIDTDRVRRSETSHACMHAGQRLCAVRVCRQFAAPMWGPFLTPDLSGVHTLRLLA